jgi:hypothetical protein
MRVISYTFEADVHCPHCTKAYADRAFLDDGPVIGFPIGHTGPTQDEHGVSYGLHDREGNPIRPVFDIDEDPDGSLTHCGDCHEELT